jgi:hypothetical protein
MTFFQYLGNVKMHLEANSNLSSIIWWGADYSNMDVDDGRIFYCPTVETVPPYFFQVTQSHTHTRLSTSHIIAHTNYAGQRTHIEAVVGVSRVLGVLCMHVCARLLRPAAGRVSDVSTARQLQPRWNDRDLEARLLPRLQRMYAMHIAHAAHTRTHGGRS